MKYFYSFLIILFIFIGSSFLIFKQNPYDFNADVNGTNISLKNFKGEYKAIYFGYLYCPDVCPSSLFALSSVLDQIGRDDFKVIFITLDPERDNNDDLTQMAKNFYNNSIGLNIKNLDKVTKNYGVKFKKIPMPNSAMIYSIAHSSSIYLLDKNGNFFKEISNLTQENIKESLEELIKERP